MQAEQRRARDEHQLQSSRLEEQTGRADQLAATLREERQMRAQLEPPLPALATPASFTLSPGVLRGSEALRRLEIPTGAILVELKLDMAQNTHQNYKAVLLHENREVFSRSGLQASETPQQILLVVEVPASALPAGDYRIDLYGSDERQALETYVFRISHR
jgi:hypothetical protein